MAKSKVQLGNTDLLQQRLEQIKIDVSACGGRLDFLLEPEYSSKDCFGTFWEDFRIDSRAQRSSRTLFESGHYSQSIAEAIKDLEDVLGKKAGTSAFRADVPRQAFGGKSLLQLRIHSKERSNLSAQEGYMNLIAGAIQALRNPRSHETVSTDDALTAVESLLMCSHFYRIIDLAKKPRRKASP